MTRCTVTVVCVAAAVLCHWWLTAPDRQRQQPCGWTTRWY